MTTRLAKESQSDRAPAIRDLGGGTRSIAIIWHRLGPYHVARLRAAAAFAQVFAIEMTGEDRSYSWEKTSGPDVFKRITLFPDVDCNAVSPREVSRRLHKALDEIQPDALFIPGWGENFALSALAWSLQTGTPNVLMTDSSREDKKRTYFKEAVKSIVARRFQAGIVAGRRQIEYVEKLGMQSDRVWPAYDVVDNVHFHSGAKAVQADEQEERLRLGLPTRYFLSVSRFVRKKNLPLLLNAFAQFRESRGPTDNDWHLVLLGDGPLRQQLIEIRAKLGLKGAVHMPGFKQYAELPSYYGLAEAFVLASTEEQWGLVVNEAMAAGLSVVISNRCGCAPDLVRQGVNGFTFDPEDQSALLRLMVRLATNDSERSEMGRASQKIIADWTPQTFGSNLCKATEAALSQPRPRHTMASRLLLPLLMRLRNSKDE